MKSSENFSNDEIKCKCGCGLGEYTKIHFENMETLREELGKPITIISGCRCKTYNRKAGGAARSRHLPRRGKCDASDISVSGMKPEDVAALALSLGIFGGIGVGETRIHVDSRPFKTNPTMWYYSNKSRKAFEKAQERLQKELEEPELILCRTCYYARDSSNLPAIGADIQCHRFPAKNKDRQVEQPWWCGEWKSRKDSGN